MPNPQQPVSGDALVILCAQKINQRDQNLKSPDEQLRQAQHCGNLALMLTGEIAEMHEAMKAGGSWPKPEPEQAVSEAAATRAGSASIPRPATQPI